MVAKNFEASLAKVLRHEGGYVNHPSDPGGPTNKGVTQRVYDAYRLNKGLHTQSVRYITDREVADIYRNQYWHAVRGNDLPDGIDYAVFDYAVNSGPGRAIRDLQRVIGEAQDGIIGQRTLARANGANDREGLIHDYLDRRLAFLRGLKTWRTFGRGWASRVASVRVHALALAHSGFGIAAAPVDDGLTAEDLALIAEAGKADPADTSVARTDEGKAGAVAGIGALGSAVTDAANQLAPYQSVTPVLQYVFIALTIAGIGLGLWLTYRRFANGAVA